MLNIAEQLGIRNARRNGLPPYRTRNNSRGRSAEETTAGQCQRLAGHGRVSIKESRREPRGDGWRCQAWLQQLTRSPRRRHLFAVLSFKFHESRTSHQSGQHSVICHRQV